MGVMGALGRRDEVMSVRRAVIGLREASPTWAARHLGLGVAETRDVSTVIDLFSARRGRCIRYMYLTHVPSFSPHLLLHPHQQLTSKVRLREGYQHLFDILRGSEHTNVQVDRSYAVHTAMHVSFLQPPKDLWYPIAADAPPLLRLMSYNISHPPKDGARLIDYADHRLLHNIDLHEEARGW